MSGREGENRQSFRDVNGHAFSQAGGSLAVLLNCLGQVGICGGAIQGVIDGADVFSHFDLPLLVGHVGQGILLQVELVSLPRDPAVHSQLGSSETGVVVTGD